MGKNTKFLLAILSIGNFMKKSLIALSLLTTTLISSQVLANPIFVYRDAANKKQMLSVSALPQALNTVIKDIEVKDPNLYKITVYRFNDYYVLYLLSGKYWQLQRVRVDIDSNGKTNVIEGYKGNDKERQIFSAQYNSPVCPDNSVEVVAISAYPGLGDVSKSIDAVYQIAKSKYKAVEVLTEQADGQTYANWLSCPNLKGFYTIGHGDNEGIMVGNDDVIDYQFFQSNLLKQKYKNTTLVFNSCEVYNHPLGSELLFGSNENKSSYRKNPGPTAYQYVGGYTSLLIGSSEDISACFLSKAMSGAKMDNDLLQGCVSSYDFYYQDFGLAYPGKYFGM